MHVLQTFTIPLLGLVALALYRIISVFIQRRRDAALARRLNCKPMPIVPNGGFLGINFLREMQQADREQAFPDLLIRRFHEMSELTGRICTTWQQTLLGQTQIFTHEPENVKAMLATQFSDFEIGPQRAGNFTPLLGDGIFVQDGKKWEHSRALLRPNFVRDQISDLDLEERHVQHLINAMPMGSDGWTVETNIQRLFFRFTIDTATEFLFGDSVDSQINEAMNTKTQQTTPGMKPDEKAFSLNFDSSQMHLARRVRFGNFYWWHNPKDFQDNNRVVRDFVMHYVNIALRKTPEKLAESKNNGKYVFLDELARQTRDPEELYAQLMNILLAGRDTTASLLSWLFHQLLRNPRVFAELRKTIIETFGTYEDPKEISFATLKGCQYLQQTLNETLRLWAVVPGNARRSVKPTSLPRGGGPDGQSPVFIPAGTEVAYSVHVMMRRKDLWGEDADTFRPERFIGRRPGWEFLPFNGGPRICIGQQFALTEASYVVVRLLQRFDALEARPEELQGRVRSGLTLTNCPGRPVTLRLREARQ